MMVKCITQRWSVALRKTYYFIRNRFMVVSFVSFKTISVFFPPQFLERIDQTLSNKTYMCISVRMGASSSQSLILTNHN